MKRLDTMSYNKMKFLLEVAQELQITIATISDFARLNNTLKHMRG